MKDFVLELASSKKRLNDKLNAMREYLQAYILKALQGQHFFLNAAFVGGTALRFLYNLPRFSQDLDFSMVKKKSINFTEVVNNVKRELMLAGYEVSITAKEKRAVHSAMFKFKGLLYEAGISPLASENFSIKIEIDTNPPKGANFINQVVNKHFIFSFLSYDVSSSFGGKINAVLSRKYTKGRDFFDLGWYLSKWKDIVPNILLLNNGLKQINWKKDYPTKDSWRGFLYTVVKEVDWQVVKKDIENFLENPLDLEVFNKENLLTLIKQ